jgi:hypothetical protein
LTFLASVSTSEAITCNLLLILAAGEIEMLEPSANRILTLAHALQAGLFGCALLLALIAQAGAAESLPASVRACTAETDRDRRLDCFDREVARFPDSTSTSQTGRAQPAPQRAPTLPAASAAPAAQTAAEAPAAKAPSTSTSSGTAAEPAARKTENAGKPGRIAARLVSIERAPNEMVLHLDNGEVWEEVQSVAGDLSLKVGDNITIDKRLGSYWLTGPHVSGMKVRQKS